MKANNRAFLLWLGGPLLILMLVTSKPSPTPPAEAPKPAVVAQPRDERQECIDRVARRFDREVTAVQLRNRAINTGFSESSYRKMAIAIMATGECH